MKKKRSFWDDVTVGYLASLRHGEEELGLIIKGHLFIEFIMNQIIEFEFKIPKIFLNDNRTNSFLVKLNTLYSLGLLPKHIYQNITTVNKLRNQYAHNLKVDKNKLSFIYCLEGKEINRADHFKKMKNPSREYIKILCFGTLTELRNYYIKKYGELPNFSFDDYYE